MRYLPHTSEEIESMLDAVGMRELDDLFAVVPHGCRRTSDPKLPDSLTEWELNDRMSSLSGTMAAPPDYSLFMGAGSYEHHIPHSISYLLGRSEFSTAYTPYQPEISQGTLQGIYEYQTLVSRLLGMDVANASLYDGASALAEALLMAIRATRKGKVAISRSIHPLYREVVRTYFQSTGYEILELPYLTDGTTDFSQVTKIDDLAAVAVQSPNFFGVIEDLREVSETAHQSKALSVSCFTEPLAYGLLKNPGSQGVDITCGEGQSLGIPRSFGGPGLGVFACRDKFVRNMPGRLVGQTTDRNGKRGFVLTLATREQHIRREKATSNICTNNSLCALTAAMFMASAGGTGMRELARLNYDKSEYLKGELSSAGFKVDFSGPTFNEFVVEFPAGYDSMYERLLEKKIVAGLPLASYFPELPNRYLLCVTETKTKADMDALVREMTS
jgi:glycine cleavage system P protein (glycine dehydrogenase) subunit 1